MLRIGICTSSNCIFQKIRNNIKQFDNTISIIEIPSNYDHITDLLVNIDYYLNVNSIDGLVVDSSYIAGKLVDGKYLMDSLLSTRCIPVTYSAFNKLACAKFLSSCIDFKLRKCV